MNKKLKDDGLVSEIEPSSLSDRLSAVIKDDQLSLADTRKEKGVEDYQENKDEENYKNGWYFLFYVTMNFF